jgi:sugar phosphate isomerase/epimerase
MKPSFLTTRRKFLTDMAGAGMAVLWGNFPSPAFGMAGKRTSDKIMVFSKQLEWLTDYNELCQLVAEIGFDGIELTVRPGGHVLPERVEEDLPRAVEAAKRNGIEIIMITTKILDPRDSSVERILTTANQLGIGFYRMGGLSYSKSKTIEQNLEEFKAIFRDLSEMNKHYQIHGAYQNHAGSNRLSAPIWDLWLILKELDPRWIGCQYDTRHAQLEGGSWWPIGLELLKDYIHTTVVKDFKWVQNGNQLNVQNCPIGEGVVDFIDHFELVDKHQISGPISLHFPYSFLEETDNKSRRREKTLRVMRQKGVETLQSMLQKSTENQ